MSFLLPISAPILSLLHEVLIDKANEFLDSLRIEFGDPASSEESYFQKKKSILFVETQDDSIPKAKSILSAYNSPLQLKSSPFLISSELYKKRVEKKSLQLVKPLEFSSPQINNKRKKNKPSIEYFSDNNSTLLDLEISMSEEGKNETSLCFDSTKKHNNFKKTSNFSTLFQKSTLDDDFGAWVDKEDQLKSDEECISNISDDEGN